MLKKLLKYDLEWIVGKVLLYYTAATLVLAVLTRVMTPLGDRSTAWEIVVRVMMGLFFSAAIPLIVNAFMRGMVCLRRTLYGDPSYLTHTLPIRRKTVFNAKALANTLSLLYALVVALLGAAIVYLTNRDVWDAIRAWWQMPGVRFMWAVCAVLVLLELLYMQFCATLGLVLGHRRLRYRNLWSVMFAVGIYFAGALVLFGLIYSSQLVIPDVANLFDGFFTPAQLAQSSGVRLALGLSAALYALFDAGLFLAARRVFCKGIDVE